MKAFVASEWPRPHNATHIGPAAADQVIRVHLHLTRDPTEDGLHREFDSPQQRRQNLINYRRQRYGTAAQTVAKAFPTLKVIAIEPHRRMVTLEGTIAQVNAAFGTELQEYKDDRHSFLTHHGPHGLPNELHGLVEYVGGLHTRQPRPARRSGG